MTSPHTVTTPPLHLTPAERRALERLRVGYQRDHDQLFDRELVQLDFLRRLVRTGLLGG